jgi:hypothetical protein
MSPVFVTELTYLDLQLPISQLRGTCEGGIEAGETLESAVVLRAFSTLSREALNNQIYPLRHSHHADGAIYPLYIESNIDGGDSGTNQEEQSDSSISWNRAVFAHTCIGLSMLSTPAPVICCFSA